MQFALDVDIETSKLNIKLGSIIIISALITDVTGPDNPFSYH